MALYTVNYIVIRWRDVPEWLKLSKNTFDGRRPTGNEGRDVEAVAGTVRPFHAGDAATKKARSVADC